MKRKKKQINHLINKYALANARNCDSCQLGIVNCDKLIKRDNVKVCFPDGVYTEDGDTITWIIHRGDVLTGSAVIVNINNVPTVICLKVDDNFITTRDVIVEDAKDE